MPGLPHPLLARSRLPGFGIIAVLGYGAVLAFAGPGDASGLDGLAGLGDPLSLGGFRGLITFALVLPGMLVLIGTLTQMRVASASIEDLAHVIGMNRLRAAYVELDPGIEHYLLTSAHDDDNGLWQACNPPGCGSCGGSLPVAGAGGRARATATTSL